MSIHFLIQTQKVVRKQTSMSQTLIKQNQELTLTATNEQKQRLDQFLSQQLPMYSRSFFKRAIENGAIQVNQQMVTKTGYQVKAGDIVTITIQETQQGQETINTADLGIEIIHEHPHFLIINKPAGLLVHPIHSKCTEVTLADWIKQNIENISRVGYIDRPGIIHRLDKYTSGLMIIARTSYAYAQFSKLFYDRDIEKIYYAIVKHHPPTQGTINLPIGRHPIQRTKMTTACATGTTTFRHAVTHYAVEQYFQDAALLRISLETGRTHQIRVHLAAIGHPIVGDIVYGTKSSDMPRPALHAHQLQFIFDKQQYTFQAPLPEDIESYLKLLNE